MIYPPFFGGMSAGEAGSRHCHGALASCQEGPDQSSTLMGTRRLASMLRRHRPTTMSAWAPAFAGATGRNGVLAMRIRPFRADDATALSALFHAAVHGVGARHYTPE